MKCTLLQKAAEVLFCRHIKGKGLPQQAEMAQEVPGRLRPRIFLTFGTTRVVGRQPYAPAAFTPGEIPGTHFQRLSRPQVTWFRLREPRKKSPVTPPGIDPGTVRLIAQFLNHYATQGPYLYLNTTVNQKVKWAKPGNFHRKRFFFRISERTLLRL